MVAVLTPNSPQTGVRFCGSVQFENLLCASNSRQINDQNSISTGLNGEPNARRFNNASFCFVWSKFERFGWCFWVTCAKESVIIETYVFGGTACIRSYGYAPPPKSWWYTKNRSLLGSLSWPRTTRPWPQPELGKTSLSWCPTSLQVHPLLL